MQSLLIHNQVVVVVVVLPLIHQIDTISKVWIWFQHHFGEISAYHASPTRLAENTNKVRTHVPFYITPSMIDEIRSFPTRRFIQYIHLLLSIQPLVVLQIEQHNQVVTSSPPFSLFDPVDTVSFVSNNIFCIYLVYRPVVPQRYHYISIN
jgi:hypothetical protein